jgi:hypothetical protein
VAWLPSTRSAVMLLVITGIGSSTSTHGGMHDYSI